MGQSISNPYDPVGFQQLPLTYEQVNQLNLKECIYIPNLIKFDDMTSRNTSDGAICPILTLNPKGTDELPRWDSSKFVIAMGFSKPVSKQILSEPVTTELFNLGVGIFNPVSDLED